MRILTVRQPWAWAIIHAGKDVENRTRNIAGMYRGPVAIHAGLAAFEKDNAAATAHRMAHGGETDTRIVFGAIIGVANLWAVHQDQDGGNCCPHRPVGGPGGSPWAERGAWHLCLDDARPLREPLPYRGALGLRDLPAIVVEQIGVLL
ncbi:hypothetical protein IT072_03825 [Leifsonia sp. ZF2019]|uniref:hypothetical protein n=1 Tax=Leifsonia sp. ZF2019 TaxID=2781978 RepID=UPI001CBA934B|nr:hypothetical protein [Leifsonia sp. ZF2019]UAJ80187.1 hypothetical protein IT072_03825 [Leifsonia sp. ZF2019]